MAKRTGAGTCSSGPSAPKGKSQVARAVGSVCLERGNLLIHSMGALNRSNVKAECERVECQFGLIARAMHEATAKACYVKLRLSGG